MSKPDGGFILPDVINPPRRCLTIMVPDDPAHLDAFWGSLQILAYWFSWQRDPEKKGVQVSSVWTEVIQEAHTKFYSENPCEVDVNCLDVADCIQNDATTRAAVQSIAGTASQPGTTAVPGERLPDSTWAANLTPTDDCDLDVLWAQCSQFTDYVVTAGNDFLETMEVYSNAVEAAQFIEMAPVIGTIVDEVQIDKAIDFINWIAETFAEFYEGADTQPNRQAIACALFCASRANCEMSLESAFDAINERTGGIFTPSSLNSMDDLIDAALTIVTNPALPLDVWVAFVLAFARVAGYLGIRGLDATLNIVLKVAVNDANNDWELLCTDCPPEDWCRSITGSDLQSMFTPTGGLGPQASWTGTGYGANNALIPARITLEGDLGASHTLTSIRVIFSGTNAIGDTNDVTAFTEDFMSVIASETFTQNTLLEFAPTALQIFEIDVVSSFAPSTVPITVQIDEIQITGTGTEPSFGTAC